MVLGDEADAYANSEDLGKIYGGLDLRKGQCHNISGSGINSPTIIDISGKSTSKYVDDPATGERLHHMVYWPGIEISDMVLRGIPGDLTELIDCRNFWGRLTMTNVDAEGFGMATGAAAFENMNGSLALTNCRFAGGRTLFNDVESLTSTACTFEGHRFPAWNIILDTPIAANFPLGSLVTGGTSGVVGRVIGHDAANASRLYVVQTATDATVFTALEALTGAASAVISSLTLHTTKALELAGSNNNARCAVAAAKGATTIQLAFGLPFTGQTGNFTVGQVVTGVPLPRPARSSASPMRARPARFTLRMCWEPSIRPNR